LVISDLGSSDLWGREEPKLWGAYSVSTRAVSATASLILAERRRGVDGELGGQNRGYDGGSYQGNRALTLTKSSYVRITGKPDKVRSKSDNGTGIMSSNVFYRIRTLGFGLRQI
jgi:hypothetical protein